MPRGICRFFERGNCTFGERCRFIHPGINDKGESEKLLNAMFFLGR